MIIFASSVLLLASSYVVVRRFSVQLFKSGWEVLGVAVVMGYLGLASLVSLLGVVLSTNTSALLSLLLLVGMGLWAGWSMVQNKIALWPRTKPSWGYWLLAILIFGLWGTLLAISFWERSGGSWSIAQGWGVDVPFHLGQILRMGKTMHLDFEELNFSGEFIRYPFYINLLSGLLLKAGASLNMAFHLPLYVLSLTALLFLIHFFRFIKFSWVMVALGILGVLWGSGWGYLAYWQDPARFGPLLRDGALYPMQNISYPALLPGLLVAQRAFLLGFPVFILALWLFMRGLSEGSPKALLWSGILTGLLPFAHTHSFLALVMVVGSSVLALIFLRDPRVFGIFRYWAFPAFILGIVPLASFVLLPTHSLEQTWAFRWGWMSSPGEIGGVGGLNIGPGLVHPFWLWWRYYWTNFGMLSLLPLFILVFFKKLVRSDHSLILGVGALAIWIIPNMIQFQTWDFDTNKFFAYAIFLSIAAGGQLVVEQVKYKKIFLLIFAAIILLSLPSALLASVQKIAYHNYGRLELFNEEEREMARWIESHTSEDAVILSSAAILSEGTVQNSTVIGAGRKTTLGFAAWVYTHGIDFSDRLTFIEAFLGHPTVEASSQFPADFILLDDVFREKYPLLEGELLKMKYPINYRSGSLKLFSL